MNPLVIHSFDPVSTSKVKLSVDKTNWYMNGYYLLSISEFEVHEVFDGGSVRSARLAEFYCSDPLGLRMVEFYECPSGCDNLMSACVTSEGSARVARGITDIITCTDGCLEGGDCYRYGIRYKGEYCPIGGKEMIGQLGGTQICENDFECISNVCVDGECTEPGLFQQFLEWLRDSWVGNLIT